MGIRRDDKVVEVTLTLDTSQYGDADVLADTQAIANAVIANSVSELKSVVLIDKDDQAAALDLLFLESNTSIGTENAALAITDAAAGEIVGAIEVAAGDYVDLANSQIVVKTDVGILMQPTSGTSLYVAAISRGTATYTASGIVLKLGFVRH